MPLFKSKFPDVVIPTDATIPAYVSQHFHEYGNKRALIDPVTKKIYTFNDLNVIIKKAAAGFYKKGIRFGDVIAIYSPNTIDYPVAMYALQTLGAIPTTANPLYTVEEFEHQLVDSKARYILTCPPFMDKVTAVSKHLKGQIKEVFVFGEAPGTTSFASLLTNDGKFPEQKFDPVNTVAVIPYSSGTTGVAKGVELTHYNIVANMVQLESADHKDYVDEVLAVFLPFFHIYGMVVPMGMSLYKGNTLIVMAKFELQFFLQIVQDYKVTLTHAVPPVLLALAKDPIVNKYDISSIKILYCAAAPLGPESEKEVQTKMNRVQVKQGYGMTEMSPTISTSSFPAGQRAKPGSSGVLIANVVGKVIDPDTGKELGVNQRGELWVSGPNRMKGYLNNPTATAATIDKDGFLHTGDIVYFDEDGELYIVDRLKELIKYKGFQVPPAELEELLLSHPDIADAAVVGKPDQEAGELPTAFIVLKAGKKTTLKEIAAFVESKVAPHKKLRGGIWIVDAIPKSASGKILRRMLKAKL